MSQGLRASAAPLLWRADCVERGMLQLESRERGHGLRCPYCFDGLPKLEVQACCGCGTILHLRCATELGACPTLGCEEEFPLRDLSSLVEALDLAEAALQRARAAGEPRTRRAAELAHERARRAYREGERAHFSVHGVQLHASVPTRPLRERPASPDPNDLPRGWQLAVLLSFFAALLYAWLRFPPGRPLLELAENAAWTVGGTWLVVLLVKVVRDQFAEGAPYR